MKRTYRVSQQVRRRSTRRFRLLPIALLLAAGALVLQVTVAAVLLGAGGVGAVNYYKVTSTQGLARLRQARGLSDVRPTRILDRKGRLIMELSDTTRGLHQDVALSQVPRTMIWAIISAEDKNFYSDPGIDPVALARALVTDLRCRSSCEGASTITQQVVKNMVLTNQKSYLRKLQEALIAYSVSQPGSGFSKNRILSMYLNSVFFGEQAYGVEAAARVFFGRHVGRLDLAQCAFLAGLVQAPGRYNPLGPNGPGLSIARMHYVLGRMLALKHITSDQYNAAIAEGDHFVFSYPQLTVTVSRSAAPYWTDWIQHLLTYNYGPPQSDWYTDNALANLVAANGGLYGGLTITTTLDLDMYNQAQVIMRQQISNYAGRNMNDAAIVSIDPKTAECLAMVGGVDYYSKATGSLINFAASPRQPGSSFKVFTYVTAFEQPGWYPGKIILDTPQTWPDPSEVGGVYAPLNYDKSWHGAVSIRMALANSYNMPAVKTIDAIGVQPVLRTAEQMGLWYLRGHEGGAGLSTTLGTKAVPLWQMAQGYNTLANNGLFRPMASILGIDDSQGNTLYTYKTPAGEQVIAPQQAYLITSILKDDYARVLAFGPHSVLQLDRPAAVKTGTTSNFKDNLTIGYTPGLLTAVWVGNPDNTPMDNIEGIDGAGPIWNGFMEWSFGHLNQSPEQFSIPPGVVLARVSSSGYLASTSTAWPITDLFAAGMVPHQYDPGTGPTYLSQRYYGTNFSIDGGTTGSVVTGTVPLLTGSTVPISGTTSGASGYLTQRPASNADLCGGRSWTYTSVYVNGQLLWKYVCQ